MKRSLRDYIPNDDVVDEVIETRGKRWGEPIYEEEGDDIDFVQPKKEIPITITVEEDLVGHIYDENGHEIKETEDIMNNMEEKITKATEDINLMNEGKMTNLEKDELKARIDASRPAERKLTLRRFTTDELYSEIGRRLQKGNNYLHDLKTLIDRYYDEDEDLKDLED